MDDVVCENDLSSRTIAGVYAGREPSFTGHKAYEGGGVAHQLIVGGWLIDKWGFGGEI
jgi:hypothetical protein